MGPLKNVIITLTNGRVSVHPSRVVISKAALEEVCWHSPQGEASINFVTTPFRSDHYIVPHGGSVATGFAECEKGTYKYSVVVRIPGDRKDYVLDPEVDVLD